MRLSTKLSIVVLGGAFIAVLISSLFSFYNTKNILQSSISNNQQEIAEQTMDKIDRVLYNRYLDIQVIADAELFASFLRGNGNKNIVDRRMHEFSTLTGPWDVIKLIDKKGQMLASTSKEEIGESVFQEPNSKSAYEKAMAGEVYHSDLVISEHTGSPTIIYAAPVRDEDDPIQPIVGVVVSYYSWPVILELLENTGSSDVYISLFNKERLLIASSERKNNTEEFVLKKKFNIDTDKTFSSGKSESLILPADAGFVSEETLASIVQQKGYLNVAGNKWSIVFEQPTRVAFAPVYQNAIRSASIIGFTILLIAIIILFVINRSILRPIIALTSTAQSITSGNFSKRTAVRSRDEIGFLRYPVVGLLSFR